MEDKFLLGLVFLISMFLGSFYNVIGLRRLNKEDFTSTPSHCVSCNHQLSFLDMIPVVSWTLMGGKCRYCGAKVSGIYPFGEIMTAITYTAMIYKYGFSLEALIQIVLFTTLIVATASDLKEQIVPDEITLVGTIILVLLRTLSGNSLAYYFVGGLMSFGVLYLLFQLSGGKIGGADVKLYAPIGITIGFVKSMESLFLASLVSVLYLGYHHLKGKDVRNMKFPFVPFMMIGVLLSHFINIYSFAY